MEENKTAVEWLIEQIKEDLNLRLRGFDIDGIGKQAQEMEKKQIVMAYDYHRCFGDFEHGELYYKEKFEINDKK